MDPVVSVIVPTYNCEKYLRRSIESIINQTFKDFELIIINDGSTDDTGEILDEFCEIDKRVIILENEKIQGVASSLNRGIRKASGRYIARMDADDISEVRRFEKQVDYLENNPEVGVVGSYIQFIDDHGKSINKWDLFSSDTLIRYTFCFLSQLCHPSLMMRSDIIDGNTTYNQVTAEDYDLWVRLSTKTRFSNISEYLIKRRRHDQTKTSKEYGNMYESWRKTHRMALKTIIGIEPSASTSEYLFRFINGKKLEKPEELTILYSLINQIYSKYIQDQDIEPHDKKVLKRYTADWMDLVAFRHVMKWPVKSLTIFIKSVLFRRMIPFTSLIRLVVK